VSSVVPWQTGPVFVPQVELATHVQLALPDDPVHVWLESLQAAAGP
jgi:hypothetical protein